MRSFEPAGEHNVSVDPAPMQAYRCKAHAHVEGNARGFRQDERGAEALRHGLQAPVDCEDLRRLAGEVFIKGVPRAGVRLVGVGKCAFTSGAHPQRLAGAP